MIAIAVSPIAIPPSRRRNGTELIAWCIGDPGNSYSTPNKHAETMNAPNRLASIAYSGQCDRRHATAPPGGAVGRVDGCARDDTVETFSVAATRLVCVVMSLDLRI